MYQLFRKRIIRMIKNKKPHLITVYDPENEQLFEIKLNEEHFKPIVAANIQTVYVLVLTSAFHKSDHF